MNTNNNIVEVKRSWWYKSFRSIGMFCYKYWWLILLLLIAAILFFWFYISKLKQKEQEYCKQYAIAEQSLKRLDSLIENCTACQVNDIGYIDPRIKPSIDTISIDTNNTIQFQADYILLTYEFIDGQDLDTRTKMIDPNYGNNDKENYLGFNRNINTWPINGTPVLSFGGDNKGQGLESVLINLSNFKQQFPNQSQFSIDTRGYWYINPGIKGIKPVKISATLYQGGTPVENKPQYTFEIRGFKKSIPFNSPSKIVTVLDNGITNGERIAIFTYDLSTSRGYFR
jgi:hypothetical protein